MPAPYPQSQVASEVTELFRFLGCLLAKALQDGRLVDIPLSRPFLKLMCMGEVGSNLARHYVIEHHHHHSHSHTGGLAGSGEGNSCSSDENSDSDSEMTTPSEVCDRSVRENSLP